MEKPTRASRIFPPVYIVDGTRTPFLKASGAPGKFTAADLAVQAGQALLLRQPFPVEAIDQVIMGCVMPRETEANIARIIALRLGCGDNTPAWTVQRNCASGMQAIASAAEQIMCGRSELIVAGGVEAMSQAPLIVSSAMTRWLANWARAKPLAAKLKMLVKLRPAFFKPVIALLCGLTDPVVALNMGETAEILAHRFGVSRAQMDEFSFASHQRALAAQQAGYFPEIVPVYDQQGQCYQQDTGVRSDTNLSKLSQLPAYFDKKWGSVTAGNSSQITDGAVTVLLASEAAVKRYNLATLAVIRDVSWAALDPSIMGLGPVLAGSQLLAQQGLQASDIDYWEINEAFAAQVLSCLKAWQDTDFLKPYQLPDSARASIKLTHLNMDGGAIALGHPVGASGARIVLHLAHILQRKQAKRGIASICVGGGQGGAMLIERVSDGG